jgi:hypothetical protein
VRVALIDARRPRRFAFWRRSGDADGDASLKKHETTPKRKKKKASGRGDATRAAPGAFPNALADATLRARE